MKTFVMLILITLMTDANPYERMMLKNIEALSKAATVDEIQKVLNTFERIMQKEDDKWEPLYYSAYCHVLIAIRQDESEKKDEHLDKALERVKEAYKLAPGESELAAMEGFVHMIRVTVDPPNRGQQFAGLSMQSFKKALAMDPENPRAMFLMAQMEMGTARFFQSDIQPACEKLQQAVKQFDHFSSDNVLSPTWGKKHALATLESCNK